VIQKLLSFVVVAVLIQQMIIRGIEPGGEPFFLWHTANLQLSFPNFGT
jgi:hypothetical protein